MKRTLLLLIFVGCIAGFAAAQTAAVVRGRVTDAANGEPIIGVSVVIKGTTNGGITDLDGRFELKTLGSATLTLSAVGFSTIDVAVGNRSNLDVKMDASEATLNEVVVVGYGTQRKSDLTGAVSGVKGKELASIATSSVDQALQGKIAGVLVTPASGSPGAGAVIRIRGTGTLNNSNPFYVVDGMLLDDISFLNPNDVESVEVLKDASATAIYGSRGANGVIIVTTKKGATGKRGTISLSAYYGQQDLLKKINLANGTEYATLRNEAAKNQGQPIPFAKPESFGVGTDWQDQIFRTGAPIQNVNIAARGGSDALTYGISGDYFKQDGILRGGDYQRLSLRINNEYRVNPYIKIGHNFSIVDVKNTNAAGVLYDAYYAVPIVSPRDSLGKYSNVASESGVGNPVASQYYSQYNKGSSFRTVGNLYVDIEILRGLTYRANFGLDWTNSEGRSFTPVYFVSATQQNTNSNLNVSRNKYVNKLWENTLTFDRQLGKKHHLNVLAGLTAQQFDGYNLSASVIDLLGDVNNLESASLEDLLLLRAGTGARFADESSDAWRLYSFLGRVNYSFNDRYLFTASFRRDGSSKFGKNQRFGNFPSLAVGWRLKEEAFLKNVAWLSNLKLRASWGIIGNEKIGDIAGDATSPAVTDKLDAVFGVDEKFRAGATLTKLANPKLHWEETQQTDIGFEASAFDSRLTAEIDWYRRATNDILLRLPIPFYVGSQENPIVNAAKVLNQGFDVNVGWRDRIAKEFSYNINVLLSTVHNEVLGLGEGKAELIGGGVGEGGKLATRTIVGLPIGAYYGYRVAGVYQNAEQLQKLPKRANETPGVDVKVGDLAYADTDGDGVITTKDRVYLGSPIPDRIMSLNLGASFHGLDFSIQLNNVSGNKVFNAKRLARFSTGNFESSFLNRWNGEGTSNFEPRVTIGGRNYEVSDRFLEDGGFTAIRNLQVGYTLPLSIARLLKMQSFRVYVSATNLKMWTNYSGYTPEITNGSLDVLSVGIDHGVYPSPKTVTFGLNVTF